MSGLGRRGGRFGDVLREELEDFCPFAAGPADDLVAGALATNVIVSRDRGQYRNPRRIGKCLGFTRAVILVDDEAGNTDVAAELAEVFHRRADVVGDIQRLQVVGADDDDFLAHVACNRQAEAAAYDVTKKIEKHVVEVPIVEPKFFEQFEAVDDSAAAASSADFGTAEFHREHTIAHEADVADLHGIAGKFLLRRGFEDRRGTRAHRTGARWYRSSDRNR